MVGGAAASRGWNGALDNGPYLVYMLYNLFILFYLEFPCYFHALTYYRLQGMRRFRGKIPTHLSCRGREESIHTSTVVVGCPEVHNSNESRPKRTNQLNIIVLIQNHSKLPSDRLCVF